MELRPKPHTAFEHASCQASSHSVVKTPDNTLSVREIIRGGGVGFELLKGCTTVNEAELKASS